VATSLSKELAEFHRFVAEKLAQGEADLSPEAVVDQWRELHPDTEALAEEVAAIKESLTEMAAGDRGTPFDEFDREFRAKHNLAPRPRGFES
jgi:hypothetical protein